MKAEYNGVKFEGTPEEVVKAIELMKGEKTTRPKDTSLDEFIRQLHDRTKIQQDENEAYNRLIQKAMNEGQKIHPFTITYYTV